MRVAFSLALVAASPVACGLFPDLHDLTTGDAAAEASLPPTATIQCGDALTSCVAPSFICCNLCVVDDAGNCTNERDVSCIKPDASSACNDHHGGPDVIPCSDPTACAAEGHPDDVCCGLLGGTTPDDDYGYLSTVRCMSLAACQANVSGTVKSYDVLCDPNAPDPCSGVNGTPDASCVLSHAARPFHYCK